MNELRTSRDLRSAAIVATASAALLLPIWLTGRALFWGDLTYLHQAWRASPAQIIQAGRAPLWEPSLYLGMPMAASMQGGLFYPATIVYYLFGFATATALFEFLHVFLAGWTASLWLRSLRLSWGPSIAAGSALALSGLVVSRLPFLNHLAVIAWMPGLFLFFRRPALLALLLALMFLAGYPTFIPGSIAAAWAAAFVLRGRGAARPREWLRDWSAAGAAALGLSAAQLLPAFELAALSRRSSGVLRAEALTWGFHWADFRQWVSPLLVPLAAYRPEVDWWKCVYLGFCAVAAGAAGLFHLPRRRAAGLTAMCAAVAVLILGDSTGVSRWLWMNWSALKFIRYPGNLSYLALAPLTLMIAAGFSRLRLAPALAAVAVAELLVYGWMSTPTTNRALFTQAGPLVRTLQDRLKGTRYLISPRALEASSGSDAVDWKTRLYGLTNAPYRLRGVANFGEPLVPRGSYEFMDRLLSASGPAEAASWMPWAGASRLLTPAPVAASSFVSEGHELWNVSRVTGPVSLAYIFTPEEGDALPAMLPAAAPRLGRPAAVLREREDRFSVSGEGGGWIFVAEPRYPGWLAELEAAGRRRRVEPLAALGAFQKVAVPPGPWRVNFAYDPASWRRGLWVGLFTLLGFAAYWYHRASRHFHVSR